MICQQALAPGSKLATVRALGQSTLGEELGISDVDEDELYAALDWLLERQARIEDRLAARHLSDGELVLYDVSSSYFEGRTCPLAKLGYSRDGRRGSLQIVYGLLCDRPGRPLAVEVFTGERHDDKTLPAQIDKLRRRFDLKTVIVVADRGMVTKANLQLMADAEGVAWITALKAPQIKALADSGQLQLSLFDEVNLAEITSADYPDERLVVCRNPLIATERARKREELLAATERDLEQIAQRVARGTIEGADQIGLAVGPALKRYRVKKHFDVQITDTSFTFARKHDQITSEAALDGFYVLRTNLAAETLAPPDVVRSYKQLAHAEQAFRTLKGPELEIRPIRHRRADRVRAHAFLCLLTYYLEWHLRKAWAELLFVDEQPPLAADPVAGAERSQAAKRKASTQKTVRDETCHSFRSLLAELRLQTRNTIRIADSPATFTKLAKATPLQARALELADSITIK